MGAVAGFGGCCLLILALAAEVFAVVWAILDLVNGHPHLVLDVVLLVLLVPAFFANSAARR